MILSQLNSIQELRNVTTLLGATLTKDEVDEFMKEADVVSFKHDINHVYFKLCLKKQDGNGKLDYDEFVKMLLRY